MCKATEDPEPPKEAQVAEDTIYVAAARKMLSAIVMRLICSRASSSYDAIDVASSHEARLGLEVRWMASGNTACLVQTSPSMCVSEVKQQLSLQAQVPLHEQRLFSKGEELDPEGKVPQADDSELMLVRSISDPRVTNLGHFRHTSDFENLDSTRFTMVRRVSKGINGDIFKYKWHHGEENTSVAVKKLRNSSPQNIKNAETDEQCLHRNPRCKFYSSEDPLTEIGVLSYLSKQPDLPLYFLRMLGVFSEGHFTWLVTEFADGGELFAVAAAGGLTEKKIQLYMWQLLHAVDYLHQHYIGHRDISLENVLLRDGAPRLMDYGMAVCSQSSSGTTLRYFRDVGKPFYRAPECYVPTFEEAAVISPSTSQPGDVIMTRVAPSFLCEVRLPEDMVPGQTCMADIWGYAVGPADVFALGICMFILSFQCPPWECARLSNHFFAQAYSCKLNGLESLRKMWGKPQVLSSEAMQVVSDMLQAEPSKRPSAAGCLDYPWLRGMANSPVATQTLESQN
jgi:serine/threonine protein kinase